MAVHSVNHIREAFLQYFGKNTHEVVASAPLVPHNDPTLMFVNAGMVPFKNVFTGAESRPYVRAVSSQKCVRAGGKHNDLDNVGYTARHHTFFEMLGNFSFGDYFKEDAILFAWEFLTKEMGLPKDKLYTTVYHTDDEAFALWKKIAGLPESRILRIATNDNFWAMGDTGPCGPCSEIFFDHGDKIPGGLPGTPEQDGDRYIEIWNLVFMQYEQVTPDKRISLPKPSIDTGMGLERISAVLQGVHDNYDIDLFRNLIEASKDASQNNDPAHLTSHRVIADHLRSSCFLLADGVMPSNEGRGYVLRRIMRRAMRHAHQLGCKDPLMYRLVPALVEQMGQAYPELTRAKALITEMLKLEEERFKDTLGRGLKLLEAETGAMSSGGVLQGETAFKLYDTYGFPIDLTMDILRARNIGVDQVGFDAAMKEQKTRAKAAWKGSGEKATDEVWFDIDNTHGATEFLGYACTEAKGRIVALVRDGNTVPSASAGETISVVLNQTPFYGESGGQEGDRGTLKTAGLEIAISDTRKILGKLHIHQGTVVKGKAEVGQEVAAVVDTARRDKIRSNHSATHLLHAVLRKVLGDHVTQKGSLVAQERLRFDISHPKAISEEEIETIESEVNALIRKNTPVGTRLMSPDEAIGHGALALFGEKYGEEVRVVDMGANYSVELCGGTHVERTGDIALFKIVSEGAVAAGIRRIEALTGQEAFAYLSQKERLLSALAGQLKTTPDALPERIAGLLDERKQLEKALSDARKSAAMGGGAAGVQKENINGFEFIGQTFEGIPPKDLREVAEDLKKQVESGIIVAAASFEGKASIIVAVTDDLTDRFNAPDLVRIAASATGGQGGGGKPNFAQAGGPDGSKAAEAVSAVRDSLVQAA
ncbi:MAG: alaS [Rickettsiales bacterium]|jgi:alanyl-tRNA synthetase|nr:alaS [Rickettsiales bacterium]